MLWSECLRLPKIHMLDPTAQCDGVRSCYPANTLILDVQHPEL